jgi:hypothetical protein
MSRPLRIEYPGTWYHVMNRGRRGEDIFAGAWIKTRRLTAADSNGIMAMASQKVRTTALQRFFKTSTYRM